MTQWWMSLKSSLITSLVLQIKPGVFLHILNFVVKSIIQQFDVPTSKKLSDGDDVDENVDEGTEELLKLAGDIDLRRG